MLAEMPICDIITKTGYICKGGGSAFGGDWKPKKPNDEKFLGKPNTTKEWIKKTKKADIQ